MTREQWAKLSDEERRIKVAKCIGWKYIDQLEDVIAGVPPGSAEIHTEDIPETEIIPDYLNDLNAIHGKGTMNDNQAFIFKNHLMEICGPFSHWWNATASQRAEAFVLTMDTAKEKT